MQVKETIGAGVVATSVMTAFSYALSAIAKKNFKEPLLLTLFVRRLVPKQNAFLHVCGWPLHYGLGCIWAGVYTFRAERLDRKPSLRHTLLFGCISGIVGIIIWRALFRRHPCPPQTDRRGFYQQLFVAHLLFTLSLAKTHEVFKSNRRLRGLRTVFQRS